MMKTCTQCKQEFPKTLEYFYKMGKDLRATCKSCFSLLNKKYYKVNSGKVKAQVKVYRLANLEKERANSKAWRHANKEKKAEGDKAYREAHKDKLREKAKAWKKENREKVNASSKAYRLANPEKGKATSKAYREVNKDKISLRGKTYRLANPDKEIKRTKAYRDSNRDKVRAASLLWARNNPESGRAASHKRRALLRGNEHIPYTEQESIELHGTDCHICHEPIDFNAPRQTGKPGWERGLHMDHVKPSSKSGANNIKNVKPSHGLCNLIKGNKEIYEN